MTDRAGAELLAPSEHRARRHQAAEPSGAWALRGDIFVFFHPIYHPPLLSRSLPAVTQIRGHTAGPPPPSPLRHFPSFS